MVPDDRPVQPTSRRDLLLGAGVTIAALPSAASAASDPSAEILATTTTTPTTTSTTTTVPAEDPFAITLTVAFDPGATDLRLRLPVGRTTGVDRNQVDFTVDWGDGSSDRYTNLVSDTINADHTYATTGTYVVAVSGVANAFGSSLSNQRIGLEWVRSIDSWRGIRSLDNAFYGTNVPVNSSTSATRLVSVPSALPTSLVSLANAFRGASVLNDTNIAGWDVSNVTSLNGLFADCSTFDVDIGSWNVGSCVLFSSMFNGASSFNRNLGSWNLSSATSLSFMFRNATSFDNGGSTTIDSWNVGNVTNFSEVFSGASSFNQPIGSWNTAKATTMSTMFFGASSFNQNIGTWNTGNVTTMTSMFHSASAFNQPIGSWNTVKVSAMTSMFRSASSFNQDLSGWCVSLIASTPSSFSTSANAWTLPKPVWGTCPT